MIKKITIREYVSPNEAAKLLGMSPSTIWNWCNKKKIESIQDEKTGFWYIPLDVVENLIKKQ